jgi:Leucine-rich repeat (LRR) protein
MENIFPHKTFCKYCRKLIEKEELEEEINGYHKKCYAEIEQNLPKLLSSEKKFVQKIEEKLGKELPLLTDYPKVRISPNLQRFNARIDTDNHIISLSINGLKLDKIPSEIGHLEKLTTLVLTQNHLTEIPKEIGQLRQLNTIDLSGNKIKTLPKEFGQLTQLLKLNLENNEITIVPDTFCQLQRLQELNLKQNLITQLPESLNKDLERI